MRKKLPPNKVKATFALKRFARASALCITLTLIQVTSFAQLQLLKDIGLDRVLEYNEYSSLTKGANVMYFVSNNELWKSHGTFNTTKKIKEFASITNLEIVGSTLYFVANDGTSGNELWKSNGTASGTIRVKDISPGAAGSSPTNFIDVNGILYFAANTPGVGNELWRSDGTSAGTFLLKDIAKGSGNPKNMVVFNGTLFFTATNEINGTELWKSDGTAANTLMVKDTREGKSSGDPQELTVSKGKLFFSAYNAAFGRELWATDGTETGTMIFKDVRPGKQSSGPENLTDIAGTLMFTAHDGVHGDELWKTDGTLAGTVLVKDMNPGGSGSYATDHSIQRKGNFTNINGILYFIASKAPDDFIYRSDGTEAGTVVIQKVFGANDTAPQPKFTYMDGYVYYFNVAPAYTGPYDEEISLYKMPYTGNNPTEVRKFFEPSYTYDQSYIPKEKEIINFNNKLFFFAALADEWKGFEFIKSDGTPEGTTAVRDTFTPTWGSYPREMITVNGIVYMNIYTYLSYTPPLYRTDGTPEGTYQIAGQREHYDWEAVGSHLYFSSGIWVDGEHRWQLWRTGGTLNNTRLVIQGSLEIDELSIPRGLTDVNGILYFYNDRGELWKSNGRASGTERIATLNKINSITKVNGKAYVLSEEDGWLYLSRFDSTGLIWDGGLGFGTTSSAWNENPYPTTSIGAVFYFVAYTHGYGYQIWRSDGTSDGTYIIPNPSGHQSQQGLVDNNSQLIVYNNELYVSAKNRDNTFSLFKTSDTTSEKVVDLPPVTYHMVLNDKMILFAEKYEEHVYEIYASDGTAEGTVLLTTVNYSFDMDYAMVGNNLYFNFWDSNEMWRTDGTPCGTYQIDVGATTPFALEALGANLIFGGHTLPTGHEPFVYRNINAVAGNPPCVEDAALTYAGNTIDILNNRDASVSFPNPFTESFTLRIDNPKTEKVDVAIVTTYGKPVETFTELQTNTDYRLGASWPIGIYIVKVKTQDKIIIQQVIKK